MRRALLLALVLPLAACDFVGGSDGLSGDDLVTLRASFVCETIGTARIDGSVSGDLEAGDCTTVGSSNYYADAYGFRLDEAATLTFRLDMPSGVAPLVGIRTASNGRIASSAAEGSTTTEGGRVVASGTQSCEPGLYAVAVTTVGALQTGDYRLRITTAGSAD